MLLSQALFYFVKPPRSISQTSLGLQRSIKVSVPKEEGPLGNNIAKNGIKGLQTQAK